MVDHATAIYFHTSDFLLGTLRIVYTHLFFSNVVIYVLQKKIRKMWPMGEAMANTFQNT
jgi:hypothetical protein